MSYATLASLKTYLGISATDTADDGLLAGLLASAGGQIDSHCGRHFVARSQTRAYGPGAVRGQLLMLDDDLLSVGTLTNGDGAVVANFVLWPRNNLPATAIRITAGLAWRFADGDSEIAVAGQWGYAATPPEVVVQACTRLAAHFYRQKDAQVFDATQSPEVGGLAVGAGLPPDVVQLLRPLRKRTF